MSLWKITIHFQPERKREKKHWHMDRNRFAQIHTKPQSNDYNYFMEFFFSCCSFFFLNTRIQNCLANSMYTCTHLAWIDSIANCLLGCCWLWKTISTVWLFAQSFSLLFICCWFVFLSPFTFICFFFLLDLFPLQFMIFFCLYQTSWFCAN